MQNLLVPQLVGLVPLSWAPQGNWEYSEGFPGRRVRPPAPPCWAPVTSLEDLQGDGGVLDGHDHTAVVQVEDVVFLLEHLQMRMDGALRAGP